MRHRFPTGWRSRLTIRPRSRGQALVELALILPVFLVLFASALDLGRLFYSQITIDNAAKEGALEASRNPTSFDNTRPCNATTNRVICLVINEAKGSFYSITPADVSLTCSPSPCPTDPTLGDTVTVKVTGKFTLVTPLLASFVGGQTINISASASAQLGVAPEPYVGATPTPSPSASPTPSPAATPAPSGSATPAPSASATPSASTTTCVAPTVSNSITVNPTSGVAAEGAGIPGTMFTFTAPTVNPQPGCTFSYSWSFGDGASGSGATVTHTYATKGNAGSASLKYFTVTLAISASGVAQTWTGSINVPVN
jgi:Flp pilus assembly protein TadG